MKSLEVGENAGIAITRDKDPIDKVRPRQVQEIFGDRLGGMVEEIFGLRAEEGLDFRRHDSSLMETKKESVEKKQS